MGQALQWGWSDFSCDAPEPNYTRPEFAVLHGPGYQSSMVIPFSYGKHCSGFDPGQEVEGLDMTACPDRLDCDEVNGDALLMAGYLCHPCLPNMCFSSDCENLPGVGFTCAEFTHATVPQVTTVASSLRLQGLNVDTARTIQPAIQATVAVVAGVEPAQVSILGVLPREDALLVGFEVLANAQTALRIRTQLKQCDTRQLAADLDTEVAALGFALGDVESTLAPPVIAAREKCDAPPPAPSSEFSEREVRIAVIAGLALVVSALAARELRRRSRPKEIAVAARTSTPPGHKAWSPAEHQ